MGKVISSASMSLDGFIAYHDHTPGHLFDWYDNGPVEVTTAAADLTFHLSAPSADYWRTKTASTGCLIVGRRLFDVTDGWGANHPIGVPVVVVTHQPPTDWDYPGSSDFHFVTDGIAAAVETAKGVAGDLDVGVAAGTIARQCLEAGLLDEAAIDLVPIVMGDGRPYFGPLSAGRTVVLGDPTTTIQGDRVTHLIFPAAAG